MFSHNMFSHSKPSHNDHSWNPQVAPNHKIININLVLVPLCRYQIHALCRSNELPCKCGQVKTSKESGLLTCWEDVARLLTDCKVMPINKDELIPTDSFLPANFWDSTNEVDIPQSVFEELDFWTSFLVARD